MKRKAEREEKRSKKLQEKQIKEKEVITQKNVMFAVHILMKGFGDWAAQGQTQHLLESYFKPKENLEKEKEKQQALALLLRDLSEKLRQIRSGAGNDLKNEFYYREVIEILRNV